MPILIDGHNLIAKLPDLRLDDPDDEAKLVARLRAYYAPALAGRPLRKSSPTRQHKLPRKEKHSRQGGRAAKRARSRARIKTHATVVCDHGLPGGPSVALSGGGVEVVFASAGRTADGIISERIRHARDPRGLTIVSSDREVIAVAEARGARVVLSEEFATRLSAPPGTADTSPREDVHLSADEVEQWLNVFEERRRTG